MGVGIWMGAADGGCGSIGGYRWWHRVGAEQVVVA